MGFDIPQMHLPDNSHEAQVIEAVINRDQVSVEEAVRRALRSVEVKSDVPKKVRARRGAAASPVTNEELDAFKALYPGLGLLGDLSDEQWDRILKSSQAMKREGFKPSA